MVVRTLVFFSNFFKNLGNCSLARWNKL